MDGVGRHKFVDRIEAPKHGNVPSNCGFFVVLGDELTRIQVIAGDQPARILGVSVDVVYWENISIRSRRRAKAILIVANAETWRRNRHVSGTIDLAQLLSS